MRKTTKMAVVLAAMSVMVLGAATMVSADEKNGWVKEGSKWFYYVEDEAVTNQWALSGDAWYFLNEDGEMATEAFVEHDSKEKTVVKAGSIEWDDEVYYVGKDGAMITGWAELETAEGNNKTPYGDDADKAWFYFGADGVVYTDQWVLSNGVWYYMNDDGQMAENQSEDKYYLGDGGAMITGWYKASEDDEDFGEDSWVYANSKGEIVKQGWKKVDGSWYFFGSVTASATSVADLATKSGIDYVMQEDTFINDGSHNFFLKASGAMATGWINKKVDRDNTTQYYANSDGSIVLNEAKKVGSKYYAFDANGVEIDKDDKYIVVLENGKTFVNGTTVYDSLETAKENASTGNKIIKLGTGTIVAK